jgi:hypothetical protein
MPHDTTPSAIADQAARTISKALNDMDSLLREARGVKDRLEMLGTFAKDISGINARESSKWEVDDVKDTPFQICFHPDHQDEAKLLVRGVDVTEWVSSAGDIIRDYFIGAEETAQSERDDFAFDSAGDR